MTAERPSATNREIAARFEEMADLLEAQDVDYKPRAYRQAAESIREYSRPVAELTLNDPDALDEIPSVGEAIAEKTVEYVETGSIEELEELRADLPVDMDALTAVEGVGPKTVGKLYDALDVRDLDDLEAAAEAGRIREVSGFGEKTESNILAGIEFARRAGERHLLGETRPIADDVLAYLGGIDGVERAEVAGSIRRWKETIGDVDVLVASEDAPAVVDAFTGWPGTDSMIEAGDQKASIRSQGVRVDLRVVDPSEFGSALQYFTGSKEHNVTLRNLAIDRELKMNEYGVFDVSEIGQAAAGGAATDPATSEAPKAGDTGAGEAAPGDRDAGAAVPGDDEAGTEAGLDEAAADAAETDEEEAMERGQRVGEHVAGDTEESMYEALDLPWIPPEMRRDTGEIEAAAKDELPDLIEPGAICGDLHTHTDWSDGAYTIEEMVAAAAEFGHDYHAVTDHADGPGTVADTGLSEDELREQMDAVEAVAAEAEIDVFHGVEANIHADGRIDVGDDVLAELDLVVASPHSALDQRGETATERLVAAVEHPHVDVLGHPSGRLLGQRKGMEFDVRAVAEAAANAGTALEINSNPHRLDLWGHAVQAAIDAGATIAINTDAHGPAELEYVRYGIYTARRGWAEPADVLNARDADGVREFLS